MAIFGAASVPGVNVLLGIVACEVYVVIVSTYMERARLAGVVVVHVKSTQKNMHSNLHIFLLC